MSPVTKWLIQSQYCTSSGPVDAELVVQIGHGPGIGERPQDGPSHIPRQELPAGEDDHAEQPQRDQREQQPLRQASEDRHRGPSPRACGGLAAAGCNV